MFLNRFSHKVVDQEGFALMQFTSYADAKWFVRNKPDYKIKKINFDLSQMEECLF